MTTPLPVRPGDDSCWNRIGVRGDHTCPELAKVTHCHNCPIFASAGRRFLDAPSPAGYLDEWTERLAAPVDTDDRETLSVILFQIRGEWLALPVTVMVEVTHLRPIRRVPHRGGLLAGLVNIRGELLLSVRFDQLLGLGTMAPTSDEKLARHLVIRKAADTWAFAVEAVDRVHRIPASTIDPLPPTVARAASRLTRGVFQHQGKAVGLIDEQRFFQALRERVR